MITAHNFFRLPVLFTALAVFRGILIAQVVSDGTTNSLNNVTSGIVGAVTVGTNGDFTTLIITNGAVLTNGGNSTIGLNTGAASNLVLVTGSGSRWSMAGDLRVGNSGDANRLEVRNGALVQNDFGILGVNAASDGNFALVQGNGTYWSNRFQLRVGDAGSGNMLEIRAGALVGDNFGIIGNQAGSSNNSVLVTAAGSLWSNRNELRVGDLGPANLLVVSNNGVVYANDGIYIGFDANSTNNRIVTDGGTLLASNSAGTALLDIRRGTNMLNSGTVEVDQLVMTNGLSRFDFNGGTLITHGGVIDNEREQSLTVGSSTESGPAIWDVRAGVSNVTLASNLVIGGMASNAQLLITNGQRLSAWASIVGKEVGASNGQATITGTGSVWSNVTDLIIGDLSDGNRLVVGNGALVVNSNATVGNASGSFSNSVLLMGGSVWSNRGTLSIGENGAFNQMTISNGGVVVSRSGYVGRLGSNSTAVVTGPGSAWRVEVSLNVGANEDFNRLIISDGGMVTDATGTVGTSGKSNTVVVTGPGSVWSNSAYLNVGMSTNGNQLIVSNGGAVYSYGGRIGELTDTASDNSVLITGAGSVWKNTEMTTLFSVGTAGSSNRLTVSDGGRLITPSTYIGDQNTAQGNVVTVTGTNSVWTNAGNVIVGGSGMRNQLIISAGGTVIDDEGALGIAFASRSNSVLVTGAGSSWINSGNVSLGPGDANQVVVSNGAAVASLFANIGYNSSGSASNVALVTGSGSIWRASSEFRVGFSGYGNQLTVSAGGVLTSDRASIGTQTSGNSNLALITGAGSLWQVTNDLNVGSYGSVNQLVISNGGKVLSTSANIGAVTNANSNSVLVTGTGSIWSNSTSLFVGSGGAGNQLTIMSGGTVSSPNLQLGSTINISNNNNGRIVVAGGSLLVTNSSGTGRLNLVRGESQINTGSITVDVLQMTNAAGTFDFMGGTLNVRTSLVANTQPFFVGNGSFPANLNLVGTNTHTFSNNLVILSNAVLSGSGTVGGSITNFGSINAGSSPGSLRINGDLRLLSSSMMSFELGGLIATNQYDQVVVSNFVQFAGTLSLLLINNFLPDNDDTFTLLKYGSSSGSFVNAGNGGRVSFAGGLASFRVTYTTNLVLSDVRYDDTDGDGQGDLQESIAGTNPNDPNSALAVTLVTRDVFGRIVIRFQGVAGKVYRVEYSNDLVTWQTVSGATITIPSAGVRQWIDDGTLTGGAPPNGRYYRIGLQ